MTEQDRYNRKVNYRYVLSEYWKFARKHKFKLFLALFLVVVFQGLALVDKFIFKVIIDRGTEYSSGIIALDIFLETLLVLFVIYVSLELLRIVTDVVRIHFQGKMVARIVEDIKNTYFNHILDLDHEFHTTHKTGSLISRINRCSNAVDNFSGSLTHEVAPFIVQILILSGVFAYFSWVQSLVLFGFSIIYLINTIIVTKRYQKYRISFNRAQDSEKANLADIFTNIDSVRYFGKNKNVKEIFRGFVDKTFKEDLRGWYYWKWADISGKALVAIGFLALLVLPIKEFIAGNITLGTVTFVYTAYLGYLGAIRNFSHSMRNISRSLTDMEDLFEYGKTKNNIKDKTGAKNLEIEKGRIEFNKVDFGYTKDRKIFEKFDLKIPANKTVAFVGHSGCGKTSLVKLLYRLYDIENGEIIIDGQNIKDVKQESLRGEMSIVPQECILFDDTVYNNIKFANPKAKRKDVMEAIKFAQLDRIISTFPEKENTIVGERGVKLSGGEKQRVSIARAILANKKILVLDEATSALDSETEWQIQQDLEKLMEGRTSIIIAHRLSTIMKADMIVVMKDGKIEQKGTHRELITEGGEYAKLWEFQKGGYVE
ncbi:hypothetical protein CMI41_04050 [Candidatus Pacearchaeota archaeon]|nr:hypothetical protein [Candidatus Pacearchaeota archaeon]|tara:strand:+ start:1407 stop:3200 length:1794 start_codon:yes stop_codon:yes gene_type:complete